jgi:hypothetical protein
LTGSVVDQSPFPGSLHCAMGAGLITIHCQNEGTSPATLVTGWIDHTLATTPSLQHGTTASLNQVQMGSNGQDVAVSPSGSRLAVASGAPYLFPVYDTSTLTLVQQLGGDAYPNNVEYGSDGRLFAGAGTLYSNTDLWVYREDGTLHSTYLVRGYALDMWPGSLKVSGDAMFAIATTQERLLKIVPVGP